MNEFKLADHDRSWLQAYNSIILFWFFIDRHENHPHQIELFDQELNKFVKDRNFPNNGKLSIIDSPTIEALVFITLSRIHEFIQAYTQFDEATRNRLYRKVISKFRERLNVNGYEAIIKKYKLNLVLDDYSKKSDEERLYQLVRAIRCKIVHFDNETDRENIKLTFTDKDANGIEKTLKFKVSFAQLLIFCLNFVLMVNAVLNSN